MNEHPQLASVKRHAIGLGQGYEPMIRPEPMALNRLVNHRYRCPEADHALIVQPTAAKDDRLTDLFCAHHADRGVDVWVIAAAPHRCFMPDRVANSIMLGHHISQHTGLPVFMMGTGQGAAIAHRAVRASDVFWGAVLVGSGHDISGANTRHEKPASGSLPDNTTRPTQQPPLDATRETSPILWIVGQDETFGPTEANTAGNAATDHLEVYRHRGVLDELLGSPAALSDITLHWSLQQFNNHFNPKWNIRT